VAIGALFAALFFGGLLWWYHGRLLDVLGLYDLLKDPGMHAVLARYAKLSLCVTGVAVFGAALFVIIMSACFLHRISGPVYRMKLHMMSIMAGEPVGEMTLRNGDQLGDLARMFNDLLHHLGVVEVSREASPPVSAPEGSDRAETVGARVPARAGART
jgi:hypothetical protein